VFRVETGVGPPGGCCWGVGWGVCSGCGPGGWLGAAGACGPDGALGFIHPSVTSSL